jgi:hypothetical protein
LTTRPASGLSATFVKMQFDFLDPMSNMRVNTGAEFRLALKGINDDEIPGMDVVATAMGLMTSKTRRVSIKVQDVDGRVYVIKVEKVAQSTFHVQEKASTRINQLIPVRVWHNGVPVAGYRASRDGVEIPMHDVNFVPYKLVVTGLDTNDVQAIASAMWNIQLEIKHIEVRVEGFTVKRTHIRETRFRMTTTTDSHTRMAVRVIKGVDTDTLSILNTV